QARTADRAARLHRQRAGWSQPLVNRAFGGMAAVETQARRRGQLRPRDRPEVSPRDEIVALAAGQVAGAVHDGAVGAEGNEPDEAAAVRVAKPRPMKWAAKKNRPSPALPS